MITRILGDLRIWALEMLLLFVLLVILTSILIVLAAIYFRIVANFHSKTSMSLVQLRRPCPGPSLWIAVCCPPHDWGS